MLAAQLLHLGKHKQVHRSAQQRAADGHIESQHRVRCEEDSAHKSKHQKERRKNTDCDGGRFTVSPFLLIVCIIKSPLR